VLTVVTDGELTASLVVGNRTTLPLNALINREYHQPYPFFTNGTRALTKFLSSLQQPSASCFGQQDAQQKSPPQSQQ
jgi:hypothetical protein